MLLLRGLQSDVVGWVGEWVGGAGRGGWMQDVCSGRWVLGCGHIAPARTPARASRPRPLQRRWATLGWYALGRLPCRSRALRLCTSSTWAEQGRR